jgi:hypothetical protein
LQKVIAAASQLAAQNSASVTIAEEGSGKGTPNDKGGPRKHDHDDNSPESVYQRTVSFDFWFLFSNS